MSEDRREFLKTLGSAAGVALAGCGAESSRDAGAPRAAAGGEAEVTPGEDLMQEHGVLERVLLVYGEAAARIDRGARLDLALVANAAGIVRRFVEDYHERLEEQHLFPRLERARREVELVAVLRRQHQRGRELTAELERVAAAGTAPARAAELMHQFERMYRPHAAREDTVLFPAFRSLLGGAAYRELGEQFEHEEHARFGARGFETTVRQVARLEEALGISDLSGFTP